MKVEKEMMERMEAIRTGVRVERKVWGEGRRDGKEGKGRDGVVRVTQPNARRHSSR